MIYVQCNKKLVPQGKFCIKFIKKEYYVNWIIVVELTKSNLMMPNYVLIAVLINYILPSCITTTPAKVLGLYKEQTMGVPDLSSLIYVYTYIRRDRCIVTLCWRRLHSFTRLCNVGVYMNIYAYVVVRSQKLWGFT